VLEMTSSAYWRVRLPWYPDGCFGPYRSATLGYSRRELLADFCVHAIGLMGGVVCSLLLGFRAMQSALPLQMVLSLAVYSAALLAMLGCSAAFNMLIGEWPSRRHALQLADHTGILLLIAGTYTPFMSLMCNTSILLLVWSIGFISFVAKASRSSLDVLPLHVVCFLAMGWAAPALAWQDVVDACTDKAFQCILLGGFLYTAGLVPWASSRFEFHNAIWHVFVLGGCVCFWWAVYDEVAQPETWKPGVGACIQG